ncbi:MAG: aldehyde dehydrogenase family protein, partial [Halieaceae bacterium]
MTSIGEIIKSYGLRLPEVVTGHIGGESTATRADSTQLPIRFAGTGEYITVLQEDNASTIERAVAVAAESFESGSWSEQSVAERQQVFRRAADLIKQRAQELALLDCLCAGLPLSHLASRQIPRAAENFELFADYIGTIAGESFNQMPGYQTLVTRQPAGVAALFVPWNAPVAMASMHIASALA